MCRNRVVLVLFLLGCIPSVLAQQTASTNLVPPLVNFSGVLTDETGKALTGIVGVTFSLYKDSQGGSPLWIETQNIHPDSNGRYTVMLGSATSSGIPSELFASGEARWLAIHPQGQSEQPRVMWLSVPYALKAVDAQTIGGSGQLAAGVARVQLENTFAQTVNMGTDYHVFVTPKGDCKGLFVTNETPGGFEVRELGGGQSNIAFDYRIVAHRKGYENLRLADTTEISKVPVIQRTNRPNQLPSRPVPVAPTRQMASTVLPVK